MALNLAIKKFEVDENGNLILLDYRFVTETLQKEPIIRKELEGDEFTFIVSSVTLECDANDYLNTEFGSADFNNYIYGIEIYKDSDRRYVGEIDKASIRLKIQENTYTFNARGWLKYIYDMRSKQTFDTLHPDLETYIADFFLTTGVVEGTYIDVDNPTGTWTGNINITNLINNGLLSKADFFTEVQKHYGFYVDIDKDYIVKIINRANRRQNYTPIRIDEPVQIHDMTDFRTFIRPNKYDGIIINQMHIISPTLSVSSWQYLRMEGGVLKRTTITNENYISQIQTTSRVLDLRQKLGAIASGTYPNVTYSWGYRINYLVFPIRLVDDTYKDYRDLFEQPKVFECSIEYNENIDLLSVVQYTDAFGGNHWNVVSLEEDPENETMNLEVVQIFSDSLPLIEE